MKATEAVCCCCGSRRISWLEHYGKTGVVAPDGGAEYRMEAGVYCLDCGAIEDEPEFSEMEEGKRMTKALTITSPPPPKIGAQTMEKVLIQGDLKALTPIERVSYYDAVCKSLGLNPLTRPFDYLVLNGKPILYVKREATEQLRRIHGVNMTIKAREVTEGCYVVTATATLSNGRQDESIGAVPIEGLKGESRSNAMMKAETKAKRRVTLSICGLGFLDESEVDSVRGASHVAIDPQTGEVLSPDPDPPHTAPPAETAPEAKAPGEQKAPARAVWKQDSIHKFGKLKARLGPEKHVYYSVLAEFGVPHCNQFTTREQALACYRQMEARVREWEDAANLAEAEIEVDRDDETWQDPEATV